MAARSQGGGFCRQYIGGSAAALWKKVNDNVNDGAALIIYSAQNEQGFQMEVSRTPERSVVDMEGISLIRRIVDDQN